MGQLVATDDKWEPYRLLDGDGALVAPVAVFLRELLAAVSTLRSYGMDLLRWWRFLHCTKQGDTPRAWDSSGDEALDDQVKAQCDRSDAGDLFGGFAVAFSDSAARSSGPTRRRCVAKVRRHPAVAALLVSDPSSSPPDVIAS